MLRFLNSPSTKDYFVAIDGRLEKLVVVCRNPLASHSRCKFPSLAAIVVPLIKCRKNLLIRICYIYIYIRPFNAFVLLDNNNRIFMIFDQRAESTLYRNIIRKELAVNSSEFL